VRFFNFWEPEWPESLKNQLNPDVTVRSRGIMEKCTFCIQRIRRTGRDADRAGGDVSDEEFQRALNPACVNACPTQTLEFGDLLDVLTPLRRAGAKIKKELESGSRGIGPEGKGGRGYRLLEDLGTNPSVVYLRKVDEKAEHTA
jgi:molybdopterin-containing oxidoreductase family iron-sulfur binding subunit